MITRIIMKTIEYFVIRHWEEWGSGLSVKWIITSISKWEEIIKLIWDIWDRVVKIIHSDTTRAKETWESIAKWLWIMYSELKQTYGRQCENNYANNVSAVVNQFSESNLIVIVIWHLHSIYTVAKELWYKWNDIKKPNNLEWYHFKTERDELLIKNKPRRISVWDKIEETWDTINEVWITTVFWNRAIIWVKIEASEHWLILDNETYEIIKIDIEWEKYRIINFWKETENPECMNYYIEIIKNWVRTELLIDTNTLKTITR